MSVRCPRCKDSTLRQIPYSELGGVQLPRDSIPLRCPECAGLWVSFGSVAHLASGDLKIQSPSSADLAIASKQDAQAALCPAGHGFMTRNRVPIEHGFRLDRCHDCGGTWFDAGEWNALSSDDSIKDLPDLWDPRVAQQAHQESMRKANLHRLKTTLGPSLFNQVLALATTLKDHPGKDRALAFLAKETTF
jgi:Zn-finger nucleic acid-binding protein